VGTVHYTGDKAHIQGRDDDAAERPGAHVERQAWQNDVRIVPIGVERRHQGAGEDVRTEQASRRTEIGAGAELGTAQRVAVTLAEQRSRPDQRRAQVRLVQDEFPHATGHVNAHGRDQTRRCFCSKHPATPTPAAATCIYLFRAQKRSQHVDQGNNATAQEVGTRPGRLVGKGRGADSTDTQVHVVRPEFQVATRDDHAHAADTTLHQHHFTRADHIVEVCGREQVVEWRQQQRERRVYQLAGRLGEHVRQSRQCSAHVQGVRPGVQLAQRIERAHGEECTLQGAHDAVDHGG